MNKYLVIVVVAMLAVIPLAVGAMYYLPHEKRNAILSYFPNFDVSKIVETAQSKTKNSFDNTANATDEIVAKTKRSLDNVANITVDMYGAAFEFLSTKTQSVIDLATFTGQSIASIPMVVKNAAFDVYRDVGNAASTYVDRAKDRVSQITVSMPNIEISDIIISSNDPLDLEIPDDISELVAIEPASGHIVDDVGGAPPPIGMFAYDIEEIELSAEAVLVPRMKTVISSSRDGQIQNIYFKNGDQFKKGDVILEYYCEDLRAEIDAAKAERQFAKTKKLTTSRLFNMDLASNLEREQANVEAQQTDAKSKTIEQRLSDCVIRAEYDGRVVKKMANDNEYTRTDRVLMEVASKGTLDVEFLLPSKSLRWINENAPISLVLNETQHKYIGRIKQIYGEVDPVSQSIQIRAGLDDYNDSLLPGMSGQLTVNIEKIREAGIKGFLEVQ